MESLASVLSSSRVVRRHTLSMLERRSCCRKHDTPPLPRTTFDQCFRAGSFNSPKLLMLSGIGDSKALEKVGIQSAVNLPSVGSSSPEK